jgi:hypothetical protein
MPQKYVTYKKRQPLRKTLKKRRRDKKDAYQFDAAKIHPASLMLRKK